MTTCPRPHARSLERALTDGPTALSSAERDELEACALCAAELAALEETLAFVRTSAVAARREEAEDLAALATEVRPEDREWMRALGAAHLAGSGSPTTSPTPMEPGGRARRPLARLAWLPLAAAALVVALLQLRRSPSPPLDGEPRPPETMLSTTVQGAVVTTLVAYDDEGLRLAWEPLDARSYEVLILDAATDDELASRSVTQAECRVPAGETTAWPNALVIEILPLSASRRPVGERTELAVERSR